MNAMLRVGTRLAAVCIGLLTALGALNVAAHDDQHDQHDDHGDTVATASLLTITTPLAGQVNSASDMDMFRFDFPGQASVEFRTSGQTDTEGELLDSTGARLASDDNDGPGDNFRITADLEPGVYYVQVDGAPGSYAINARLGGTPDHGDTVADSSLLTLQTDEDLARVSSAVLLATAGRIHPSTDDVDMFRLDVADPGRVLIRTSGNVDTYATLLDSDENQVGFDDRDGNFRIEETLDAGVYYVRVNGHDVGGYRVLAALSEDVATRNDGTVDEPDAVAGNVVINEDGPDGVAHYGTDDYQLGEAAIEGDMLRVTVSYGGGCETHRFTLVLSNAVKMTDPPRIDATLAHEANGDACERWVTEDVVFDLGLLKDIVQAGDESGTVIVELSLADGTIRELEYRF